MLISFEHVVGIPLGYLQHPRWVGSPLAALEDELRNIGFTHLETVDEQPEDCLTPVSLSISLVPEADNASEDMNL